MTILQRIQRAKAAARKAGRVDLLTRLRDERPIAPLHSTEREVSTETLIAEIEQMEAEIRATGSAATRRELGLEGDRNAETDRLIREARAMQALNRRNRKIRAAGDEARRTPGTHRSGHPSRSDLLLRAATSMCREAVASGRRDVCTQESTIVIAMGQVIGTDWGVQAFGWNGQLSWEAKRNAEQTAGFLRHNWLELERQADALARDGKPLSDGMYMPHTTNWRG